MWRVHIINGWLVVPILIGGGVVCAGQATTSPPAVQARVTSKSVRASDSLTDAECRYILQQHQPDSSVVYQGGISASGQEVAPADLTPPVDYHLGTQAMIDLEVPLDRYGRWNKLRSRLGIEVGKVRMDHKGDVYINDVRVSTQDLSDLQMECQERLKHHTQDPPLKP